MVHIPGYSVLGTLRATGSNVLLHAIREADGVAVILKTPRTSSPGATEGERYRREFNLLQRLKDVRGVVMPYACEWLSERPVLLLERVQGEPLSATLGQPMEVSRFLPLTLSLVTTLGEVHHRDVIHKDIKPSNIVVEPTGEARLLDFGMATLQQLQHLEAPPTHLIEGTLAYMSPEQTGRMNRAVDYRTDFYSLGVTFYELLTGKKPFQGRDALEWFHAHMTQRPRPPHEVNPRVPPALSAIVMKLLAKVAEERYQSAEGLKADLERCREEASDGTREVFALGTRDTPRRFQLPQRLYGREPQVARLLEGLDRVALSGQPELLLLSGYSGLGKSSVVHELYKPVVQRRGFFLSGKFDQFQQDIPYATLAQALRGLVRQLLAGSEEELTRWREQVNRVWEGQGQGLVDLVPQLEALVGPQTPLPELPSSEAQQRFFRVVGQFLSVFTKEHPMVVFLDDLQWADLSTLRLLEHLLSRPEAPPVLWLGAYRDNEVGAAHPLPPVLERLRGAGAWVEDVRLEPLNVEQVRHLVGDTLPGADDTVVTPLAALMHQKTGGNPFFLLRLLVTLHQDGLLVRLPGGGWRWDVEGARRKDYSENVVDFMVGRLRQFPERTQHLLSLAACVGNVFPLQTLGCLSALPEPGDVERELEPVLQEGLLARLGPERCRFLHDRIQQAAHSLMSDTEREQVHLRLGRLMLERLSPEELRESLFEAVSQFNAGLKWMEEPGERHQLARLNAEAGFKAQAAFALRPALTYFETAFTLIPGDPWETDYPLAFSLRLAQARTALMSGEAADAHRRVEALLPRARPRADTVAVYMVQQDIELATHDASKSMNTLLECLELLGMPVSPHPTWEEAVAAHEEVWTLLGGRSIESLIDLPLMTDPEMKMAIAALFRLNTGAYATDDNLLIIILSRIVSLTLRHGFVEDAARGCAWFGITTGWFFKNYRKGFTFAQLAHRLLEKHHLPTHKGGVLLGLQYCGYWTQPLTRALELAATGLAQARQSGDVAIASYSSISLVTNRLALGHPLDEVHHEALVSAAYLKQTGGIQDPPELLLGFQRYVEQLRGHTTSFQTLNGEGFDEAVFERHLPERLGSTQGHYWTVKLQSRFMCGAYEEARDAANRMNAWMWAQCGSLILREGRFFHALTLAACFTRDTPEQQRQTLEILARNHQQFAEWAELCPENFRAMERILFAERARIEGRGEEASCAFEEAIRVAGANGALHHQALASERAADFWRTRQTPIIAQSFAREAWKAYQQWGAPAKARHLESQWPHLATLESSRNGTNSVDTDSSSIDALTVIKAQQAISSEIVLERLVTALLRVALENAGAQRGALLLSEEDTLSVAALFQTALDGTLEEDRSRPPELPWTLLGYVRRAREHVLIGNTARPHAFLTDAYLSRGVARSVLCLPLLRGEQLSGVLYLENALATHAFSPARLGLLGHIASQAAISMENARLYADVQRARAELGQANDGLERRVEERTHELKRAQARLVDTAREVGMAEVASDVLHNVGNVLTSAVINLSLMREAVAAPRVNRLKQLAALFREQAGGLEDFLANDARGGYLPEYLDALGDELLREQQGLSVDMEEMNQHLEQIRAIVQVQQRYAKNTLMTEECDLSLILDDALSIQLEELKRLGVTVHREFSWVPRVQVDKHKVLQILIHLLSNAKHALEAMPEGRRNLWVRLSTQGRKARLQVEDDGVGIAPELERLLFTHGFTTRKDGHGFGLHTSALAARMLKGHLTLTSAGPGMGAVATLELPLS